MANEVGFGRPHSLAVHGDMVFVADMGNNAVRAVDLKSGTVTAVAGHRKDAAFRPRPIPKGRLVRPSDCAALMRPVGIALNPAGQCLVALQNPAAPGNCIVELVLDDKGRSASAGAGGEDKADSKRGTAGESPSPAPETAALKAVPDAVPSDPKAEADGQ